METNRKMVYVLNSSSKMHFKNVEKCVQSIFDLKKIKHNIIFITELTGKYIFK